MQRFQSTTSDWPGAATLTAELTRGVPHQVAVMVDGTNFASPLWQPYVTSNLTVDLPADGWHDVWVALAGRVPVGEPRWHWRRLKRDTVPPVLTITNAPLTTWPLLQIRGWSDEDLRGLSYSLGAVTNERVFVRDRHYAAATHEFTTNFFQAYDVELAPGTSVFQLRATDRAGNVTETNFTFVLEADTIAPVLTFTWPKPGAVIAADTVTVRGWLDDPTATLTAEWVNPPGQTNACVALVERHGRFWLRGLPLSAGTNEFILKAVDARTNTLVTNLTLVRGALTVTVDPPGGDLWGGTVPVSGTNWSGAVQIGGGGVGVVTVTVYPPGQEPPAPVPPGDPHAEEPPANPENDAAEVANAPEGQWEKPSRLYLERYYAHAQQRERDDMQTETSSFQSDEQWGSTREWADGRGGSGTWWTSWASASTPGTNFAGGAQAVQAWPGSGWPVLVDGTEGFAWQDGVGGWGGWEWAEQFQYPFPPTNFPGWAWGTWTWPATWWPALADAGEEVWEGDWTGGPHTNTLPPPKVLMEQRDTRVRGRWDWNLGQGPNGEPLSGWETWDYRRTAVAVVKLFTGGWSVARLRTLWELSGSAEEILDPHAVPPYDWPTPRRTIAPERIRLGEIGLLSANGNRFIELAKGETVDLTPEVPGVSHARHDVAGLERVLYSYCDAVIPTNRMRTNVGVGETVFITSVPELPAETIWESTAGSLAARTNATAHWTAPSNAHNVTITATLPDGYKARKHFKVWEPSGINGVIITNKQGLVPGVIGAGCEMIVFVTPRMVSLAKVELFEVGRDGSAQTDYYVTNPPPSHIGNGAEIWFPLEDDNSFLDRVALWQPHTPPPGVGGTFEWEIPVKWRVGTLGSTNSFMEWRQIFECDTNSTVTVRKFNEWVRRTVFDEVTTSQDQ